MSIEGASLAEGSNFPFLPKLLVRGCPRTNVWRIPDNYFNLNQILCSDLEHLRKTAALLMGSFRLWGVILECGAPGLPFPGGIWSTSGPETGSSPVASAQKESKIQYWLLCQKSPSMPWHSKLPSQILQYPLPRIPKICGKAGKIHMPTEYPDLLGLGKILKGISNGTAQLKYAYLMENGTI